MFGYLVFFVVETSFLLDQTLAHLLNMWILPRLDRDDSLYNSYFQWKGTGEMINTKFFCRLCALLHDPRVSKYTVFCLEPNRKQGNKPAREMKRISWHNTFGWLKVFFLFKYWKVEKRLSLVILFNLNLVQEREEENRSYKDINQWWRSEGTCIKGSWKKLKVISPLNQSLI